MCVHVYMDMYMDMSEDNLKELILSFHHVGPGDWTQIISLVAGALIC